MTNNETFGDRLRKLLHKSGLSQQDVADKLEIPRNTVWRWINNKATPESQKLHKLAALLQISVDELLNGEPEATWVLRVEIKTEKEAFIDLKALKTKPVSTIATYADAGFLQLGGSYELWTNDKLFNDMIKQFKKLRATVIQNGKALGGIKD